MSNSIKTTMCIALTLNFQGRSDGPVPVYCAATLAVLGTTEGPVQVVDDDVALTFGGVHFAARPAGNGSKWLVLEILQVTDDQIRLLKSRAEGIKFNDVDLVLMCMYALGEMTTSPSVRQYARHVCSVAARDLA